MPKTSASKKTEQRSWSDDLNSLGIPTQEKIIQAIDAGDLEKAKYLTKYMISEGKTFHDMACDWLWDIYTKLAEQKGEEEVYRMSRATQETWMLKRTWKAFLQMSVKERVYISAEIMRSHRCGPNQDGSLEIIEDENRISIKMDPCGSGGRMRRGDPVDGTPSRFSPPYNFGATKEPHWWCWNRRGVPYYCVHCAINEILPIEWGGYPLWVTGYSNDADEPCYWHFYRKPELIPDKYFTRLGFKKDKCAKRFAEFYS